MKNSRGVREVRSSREGGITDWVGPSWAQLCQETHGALSLAEIDGEHKIARQETDLQQNPCHPETEEKGRGKTKTPFQRKD